MADHRSDHTQVQGRQPPRGFVAYLLLTTGLCGGLVMVVEVLGSRVIGPYFGVSLFVWTALISVTLLSLAGGYAIGGRIADRHPHPEWLYGLIILSGCLVALIPLLKAPVIEATSLLGLRAGALAAATVLFAPPLLLLGCVSPYIVRIAVADWSSLGRTVGLFYAISTAGSVAGTALTGFVIVAYIGVTNALYLSGLLLCAIGVGYFVLFRGRWVAIAAMAPFVVALAAGDRKLPVAVMPDGTRVALIDSADSFYGNVKVVEYAGPGIRTREMMIDGLIQGGIDVATGQSIYEYAYLMQHLPFAAKPDAKSVLFIGLGPGAVVTGVQRRGVDADVVDIDPTVVQMAERHFGFRPTRPVIVDDGRSALRQTTRRYDVVMMDVFNGDITPGHLLSREAIGLVRERMTDGGVFAMNMIGSLDPESRLLPAVVHTLRSHFSEVVAFPLFDASKPGSASGNLVILASNAGLGGALAMRSLPGVHRLAEPGVRMALSQGMVLHDRPGALMLTDDFNPLDVFDPGLHEGVRRTILDTTPAVILLHG